MDAPINNVKNVDKFNGHHTLDEALKGLQLMIIPNDVKAYLRIKFGAKNGLKYAIMEEYLANSNTYNLREKEVCERCGCKLSNFRKELKELLDEAYLYFIPEENGSDMIVANWYKIWDETATYWGKTYNTEMDNAIDKWCGYGNMNTAVTHGINYAILPRELKEYLRKLYGCRNCLKLGIMDELMSIGESKKPFAVPALYMTKRLGVDERHYLEKRK